MSVTFAQNETYASIGQGACHLPEFRRAWRKSSRSQFNACVEVCFVGETIPVRNSRDPEGPVLVFTAREWDAFVAGVKLGEFDRPGS